jgi:hypothetical protein
VSPAGPTQGLAFIDQADNYLGFESGLLFVGGWDVAGLNWSFSSSSVFYSGSGGVPITSGLYGSGSMMPNSQFQGTYALFSPSNTPVSFSMDYSIANALAVAPGDLVGTWSSAQASIAIDAGGVVSGSASGPGFNACALSGSVTPQQPGTSKNIYAVSITLADVTPGSCFMDTTRGPYQGYGAITFANTGTSGAPFFVRTFTLLARENGFWFAMELAKQ